jgi:hypothetical protein
MINIDRSKGIASTDDDWKLIFRGNKIQVQKESVDVLVTYEPMAGGMTVILYDDLTMRGIEPSIARSVIDVAKSVLEEMGFAVELG